VLAAAALASAALAEADVPIAATSFSTLTPAAGPDGITLGSDGALWFTERNALRIGRVTNGGVVSEYPVSAAPAAITAGPDGALWFVQPGSNEVGRLSTAGGTASEISIATSGCSAGNGAGPVGIVGGPDKNIWVTENGDVPGEVATVALPTGPVTQHCLTSGEPYEITAGSDGALWFTVGTDQYERVSTVGSLSPALLPVASTAQIPIVTGPDGNLWLGIKGSQVDRITPTEIFTAFALPPASTANPELLTSGPDGQIWLAGGGDLTSITTAGVVSQFDEVYPSGDTIEALAAGPGDTLWLTDATASSIYRVALGSSPVIAADLRPVATVGPGSAVVAATLSVPAGDLAQPVTYHFEYGTTTAYGSTSAISAANATAGGVNVTSGLGGLAPDTTYHYRVLASGCAPAICQASSADQSFTTSLAGTPVLGRSVVIAAIGGRVRFHPPGANKRFRAVSGIGAPIPVGSTVDARHGHVVIESATAPGTQQVASGQFSGGIFAVEQPTGAATTVLRLNADLASCNPRGRHARIASTGKARRSHKVVDQVFGDAHGNYTTRGHYAAAADEGTSWRIADRCDGTFVAVAVGLVTVTDLLRHRTFVLPAGRHYLAASR